MHILAYSYHGKGGEINKFYLLKMDPGSKVASPVTPTVLVGGCLQVNHATPGKTVPRGRESGGRELGVNPRHWSGAWTLAGSLFLPQRGFPEKSALMNSEEQFVIQPIKCSETLFQLESHLLGVCTL